MSKPLPRIIHGINPILGAGVLILNESPSLVGHIIQFPTYTELLSQANTEKFISYSIVTGYSIVIVYAGVIGNDHKLTEGDLKKVQAVMDEMAKWYLDNNIDRSPSRFKRYLI